MSLSKKKEFNYFSINCLPLIEGLQVFNIPSKIKSDAQEITFSHLDMKNMGQVRDRFEGQSYYDKIYQGLITFYCLEKMTGKPVASKFLIRRNRSFSWSPSNINRRLYNISSFTFGNLPLIDHTSNLATLIFCIREDYRTTYFCGILEAKHLSNKKNFIKNDNLANKNSSLLINFEILSQVL